MKFFAVVFFASCVLPSAIFQDAKKEIESNSIEVTTSKEKVTIVMATKPNPASPPIPPLPSSPQGFQKATPEPKVVTSISSPTSKPARKVPKLMCPGMDVTRPFFALSCKVTKECSIFGKGMLCCSNKCLKGIPPPKLEPAHSPVLFGLVERVCPAEPLPEFLEITECTTDEECGSRICCPERMHSGEIVGYCRTAEPRLERIPGVRRFMEPLRTLMSYMQCTPPPPPLLDVFPKPCEGPLDCFPNLCCQERGRRFCRPPKRSLLALMTSVAQRLVPEAAARSFLNRATG